jgi:hypothetical protein
MIPSCDRLSRVTFRLHLIYVRDLGDRADLLLHSWSFCASYTLLSKRESNGCSSKPTYHEYSILSYPFLRVYFLFIAHWFRGFISSFEKVHLIYGHYLWASLWDTIYIDLCWNFSPIFQFQVLWWWITPKIVSGIPIMLNLDWSFSMSCKPRQTIPWTNYTQHLKSVDSAFYRSHQPPRSYIRPPSFVANPSQYRSGKVSFGPLQK